MRLDFRKANLARENLGMSVIEGWWSLFYLLFPVLPSVLLARHRKLLCTKCQAIDASLLLIRRRELREGCLQTSSMSDGSKRGEIAH